MGATNPIEQATGAIVITPDDNTDLALAPATLYVGGAGNLSVIMKSNQTVLFSNIPAGTFLPIQVDRVKATGTTATLIVAMNEGDD